jgi:hypothetical protein
MLWSTKHSQSTLCYKRISTSEEMWLHKDICSFCQVEDVMNSHGSSNKEQLANIPPYVKMALFNGNLCEEVFTTQPCFTILSHEDKVLVWNVFGPICVRHLVFGSYLKSHNIFNNNLCYVLEEQKIVILVYIDDFLITWNVISKIYKLKECSHNQQAKNHVRQSPKLF